MQSWLAWVRTLPRVVEFVFYLQKWVADGSNLKKGKSFQNMRKKPLINGPLDQLILEVFNPMELHLLLG